MDEPASLPIDGFLDLHAFAPGDVTSVVEAYLDACHEANILEVRVVHGRGIGVQRAAVQRVLARHPLVDAFWDAPESHLGATVARLTARDANRGAHQGRRGDSGARRDE